MSDLTDRLDAIQQRLDKADPAKGEWCALTDPGDRTTAPAWIVDANELEVRMDATYAAGKVAEFIAQAPTDVRFLLDLARKQQAALDAVENLAKEWDVVFERFPAAAAGIFAKSHANRVRGALEAKPSLICDVCEADHARSMADLSHGIIRLIEHSQQRFPWQQWPTSGDHIARTRAGNYPASLAGLTDWAALENTDDEGIGQ